jgi:F-type H+-transporting ATPase subunit delta
VSDQTVAHRYAHALFLVAQKRNDIPGPLEDLRGVLAVIDADARVGRLFRSPLVRIEDKRRLLHAGLETRVRPVVRGLVDLMLRKKRWGAFREVVTEYEKLVEQWQGIQRAEVVSAVELTEEEIARLRAELERATRTTLRLAIRVDPAVLGGLYVRIGDRVIDRTVKSLLEAVEHRLSEVSV